MLKILREIRKHAVIFWVFMRTCLAAQMEYRSNFVTGIAMEAGYLLVKLMYVLVVFRSGVSINGLAPDEIILFVGTFVFMTGVYAGLIMMNLYTLREIIRDGALDLYITKPVSLQFMITLRRSDLGLLAVDIGSGLVIIIIGLARLGPGVDLWRLFGFSLFMVSGSVVAYSLFVIPSLLSFWFVGANIAASVDPVWDFNNMPMGIYNRAIQNVGIYLVPIFLITNFPALYLLGRMSAWMSVWGILAPIALLFLVRILFKKAVRRYNSASS
jgi:ABC-2 type transport system permease protein